MDWYDLKDHRPDESFVEQAMGHKDDEGEECIPILSGIPYPDYSVLDPKMTRYYLYWRGKLLGGECLRTDVGYVNLFVNESVILGRDPGTVMDCLDLVEKARMVSSDDLCVLRTDICLRYGLPITTGLLGPRCVLRNFIISNAFERPLEYIHDLGFLIGPVAARYDPRLIRMVNNAFLSIDGLLYETTGKGIAETFGTGTRVVRYTPFREMYVPDRKRLVITYREMGEGFRKFLEGVCSYCMYRVGISHVKPRGFDKVLSKLIDGLDDGVMKKTQKRPVPDIRVESDDDLEGVLFKGNEGPCPVGDVVYVPSDGRDSDFRTLDDGQKEYYLYWKRCISEGRHPPVDRGYLGLYLAEVIGGPRDVEEKLSVLTDLYDVYYKGNGKEGGIVGRTIMDLSIAEGLDMPSIDLSPDEITVGRMFMSFLEKGKGGFTPGVFCRMAEIGPSGASEVTAEVADIANHVLSEIETNVPGGLMEAGGLYFSEYRRVLFDGLGRFVEPVVIEETVPVLLGNPVWSRNIRGLLSIVVSEIEVYRGGKGRYTRGQIFGSDIHGIVEDVVRKRLPMIRRDEVEKGFGLDPDKVGSAEDDLDSVKTMMTVADRTQGPVCSEMETVIEKGWGAFVDSLEKDHLRYLCNLLDGISMERDVRVEDRINLVAVERLGEPVLDDEGIAGEYLWHIRNIKHPFPRRIFHICTINRPRIPYSAIFTIFPTINLLYDRCSG
ncbi:MAG: TerB N-terminal domain-containing protein [archaeon]|nr:TerB N-terminal domain-containing protein [archaeon]